MNTLNIVDLHQEEELSPSDMARVVGGHDIDKEKALVELWGVINTMGVEPPDPPPPHVSMRLPA